MSAPWRLGLGSHARVGQSRSSPGGSPLGHLRSWLWTEAQVLTTMA